MFWLLWKLAKQLNYRTFVSQMVYVNSSWNNELESRFTYPVYCPAYGATKINLLLKKNILLYIFYVIRYFPMNNDTIRALKTLRKRQDEVTHSSQFTLVISCTWMQMHKFYNDFMANVSREILMAFALPEFVNVDTRRFMFRAAVWRKRDLAFLGRCYKSVFIANLNSNLKSRGFEAAW